MAAALEQICDEERERSVRVGVEHLAGRTWWQRWLDRLAWMLRRWL
jgi:hypothetical protein